MRGFKFKRFIFTVCMQGPGAPFIDWAYITDKEGNKYRGYAILLTPWRRKCGEARMQKAFVIGLKKK